MANETRGLLFETIADTALKKAVRKAGISGQVFWNEKPKGMSIVPDFTIGNSKDEPQHIILVTASGSAKETDKKFWRNLGEMQEVKTQLSTSPQILNLYFMSVLKVGLDEVTQQLYDATFHVERKSYYSEIAEWVRSNIDSDAKTKEKRQAILEQDMKSNPALASSIDALAEDLAQALPQRNSDLDSLWTLMREDYQRSHHPPKAKQTYVRRGIGKLSIFEPALRQFVYEAFNKRKGISPSDIPAYATKFFKRSIIGMTLADTEMISALNLLGSDACEAVLQRAPQSMEIWITPLRNLDRVAIHVDFIEEHYDEVTDPIILEQLLIKCFDDPSDLSGVASDEKVWIYEIMISLLKAKSGRLQGYGLAQLAEDTGLAETGMGAPLARFIIPKFVQREEMLKPQHLRMLAQGLADRFRRNVPRLSLAELKTKVVDWVIKENLEDRLIPYRNFEPLLWLLETELQKQHKSYDAKTAYTGWINEYAAIGKKSATTPFVRVGKTLIHWKSAYASHPNDKTKELSARARSIKYSYNPATQSFSRRSGVTQLALILDGDWKEQHLKTLASSGWDFIVYPGEIPNLVSQL